MSDGLGPRVSDPLTKGVGRNYFGNCSNGLLSVDVFGGRGGCEHIFRAGRQADKETSER